MLKIRKILFILIYPTFYSLFYPYFSFAATPSSDTQLGCGGGFGPFADVFCKGNFDVGNIFNHGISSIIGFLTIVAGLYFMFQLITAGIAWVGSGGDKASVEAARSKIYNAILGLVIVVAAWVFVGIIGKFVGLDILNAGGTIEQLKLNPTP